MNVFVEISNPSSKLASFKENTSQNGLLYDKISLKQQSLHQNSKNQHSEETGYHWSQLEQIKYLKFLEKNKELFELPTQKKRTLKIHVLMSKYINIRTPNQCRSHHQKMLRKFKSVDFILENYQHLLKPKIKIETLPSKANQLQQKKDQSLELQKSVRSILSPQFQHDLFDNGICPYFEPYSFELSKQNFSFSDSEL